MTTRASELLLGVMISFAFCATSFAQATKEKMHYYSIAPEVSSYKYKESVASPFKAKLSGTMVGFSAEYLNSGGLGYIEKSIPVQLRMRFNYMQGSLDYDGSLQDKYGNYMGPHKATGNKNYFVDMIFAGGLGFKLSEKFSISPYIGLGHRYLVDEENSNDPYDYKREQTYYYMPIGADWKILPTPAWKLTLNTEADILLRGENYTHLYGGMKFRQKSGYGFRTAFKIERNLKSMGIFAEPFYRYWEIKESDVVDGWIEPKNKTQEFGLRIGVSF